MSAETPCPEPCGSVGKQAAAEHPGNRIWGETFFVELKASFYLETVLTIDSTEAHRKQGGGGGVCHATKVAALSPFPLQPTSLIVVNVIFEIVCCAQIFAT